MENVKLIDASPKGTVTFEFLIDERYTNINGVMHGGAAGVIFDMCTTTALGPLARPGYWECVPSLYILKHFCSKVVIGNGTDEVW
jgi:acyl-coenzyme A thioesterase 13